MTIEPTFLDSYSVEAYCDGSWFDLTPYITSSITGKSAMQDNKPTTRTGETGNLDFTLNNLDKLFLPGGPSSLSGWKRGTRVRLTLVYDAKVKIWYYKVKTIKHNQVIGTLGDKKVSVHCVDWIDHAAEHPLLSPGIYANKTADEALDIIVPTVPIQPEATNYDPGVSVFDALFDTVTTETRLYSELCKLAFSEPGYIYVQRDGTLRFESMISRSGLDTPKILPVVKSKCGIWGRVDGGIWGRVDGGIWGRSEVEEAIIDNVMIDSDVTYGENVINLMTIKAFPKRLSSSAEVMYSLSTPLAIGVGQTIEFRAGYTDPTGGASVNADPDTMIAPAATTDYLMNTASDGSGTDLTANLTATAAYSTEGVVFTLTNTSSYAAWITHLQCRGYGIFQYNDIETQAYDTDSIYEFGYATDSMQQQYQRSLTSGEVESKKIVENERQPRKRLDAVHLNANSSPMLMNAFLHIEAGDLTRLTDDVYNVDGWYYIQGITFSILPGKDVAVINYTWIVKEMLNLVLGLSLIGLNINNPVGSHASAVSYGALPYLQNMPQRTFVITIYPVDATKSLQTLIMHGMLSGEFFFSLDGGNIYLDRDYSGSNGEWHASTTTIENNEWYRVAIAFDDSVQFPRIYINGVEQTIVTDISPSGSPVYETEAPLSFGATLSSAGTYSQYFKGKILNPLIYNRILTPSELAEITSAPQAPTTITDGLVFQGFAVPTGELSSYVGALVESKKIRDNIYGVIGTPLDSPVGFIIPTVLPSTPPSYNGTYSDKGANVTSLTISTTVPAGSNRALIAIVAKRAFNDVTSIVRDGQSFTRFEKNSYDSGNYPGYEVWYLVSPNVGTADTVVTLPSGDWIEAAIISLDNVDQISPIFSSQITTGTGTGPAMASIYSPDFTLMLDCLSIEKGSGTTLTATAGQTELWNLTADGNWAGSGSSKPGESDNYVSAGWTVSSSPHNWIYAAFSILGAS